MSKNAEIVAWGRVCGSAFNFLRSSNNFPHTISSLSVCLSANAIKNGISFSLWMLEVRFRLQTCLVSSVFRHSEFIKDTTRCIKIGISTVARDFRKKGYNQITLNNMLWNLSLLHRIQEVP
jgi:hypothetical protein